MVGEPEEALAVELFGPVRLWHGSREVPVRPGQQRALLALLALAAGRPVGRAAIEETLWNRDRPVGAWNVVQTHVKRLRAALEPERAARTSSLLLPRAGDGYRLRLPPDGVDLHRFGSLTQRGRDAQRGGRQQRAFAWFREAFAQWQADPVADVPLLAEHSTVTAAVERRWTAISWYTEAALALGRAADVIALAEEAARANPLDERAQATLIRLYQALGRRDTAFTTFRDTRERLVDSLGVDPGRELSEAYRQVLRAPADAATEPAGPDVPRQLPADTADFTGRREEVRRLRDLLTTAATRTGGPATVVTLTGMGGIGKTTLAAHVGHRVAGAYPDGQLYVWLRGATGAPVPPVDVLGTVLRDLGVTGSAVPNGVDDRARLYRSRIAGRRMLLVFDDAANEAQLRPLLPGTAGCAVVVTSRYRLDALAGAQHIDLGLLDRGEAVALLHRLIGPARTQAEPLATVEIAAACAGVPLALRVTGARLAARPHWPLAYLADRLRDQRHRLEELRTGDLAVRSSLAASYAGIRAGARRALRRLSLLDVADIAAWTVAALMDCAPHAADAAVDALVNAHLLTPHGADRTGTPRYRLHDLVRLYGRERALVLDPPGVRREAMARAAGAWLFLADTADARLACRYLSRRVGTARRWPLPPDLTERLTTAPTAWFDAERGNLLTMVGQTAAQGLAGHAWELADAAMGFYEMRDLRDDWATSHQVALAACDRLADVRGRAVISRNLAYRATGAHECDIEQLRRYASAASASFAAVDDVRGRADAMILLGEAERMSGATPAAAALFHQALQLARAGGDELTESVAHIEIAQLCRERGNDRDAIRRYGRSLRLCARHHNIRPRYHALRMLGVIDVHHGQFADGEARLREALRLAQTMRSPIKQAQVLREIGGALLVSGHTELAAPALHEAYTLSTGAAHDIERAFALRWLGRLALAQGDPRKAKVALTDAMRIFSRAALTFPMALTLRDLGAACAAADDHPGARVHWRAARRLFRKLSNHAAVTDLDAALAAP
ncbi:MAG: hypothetical protein AUI14_17385 [Actinobacteria bacterium 13_2_20CM_2_71_6]|nr:MAG: hypothetical protein AUI14_17385 [Actinobacteria bacterium 13_2_20CM_2_71_6]